MKPGRVMLKFDSADRDRLNDVTLETNIAEYEENGVDKHAFLDALSEARDLCDHSTIALYMVCVRLDPSQLDVVITSLELLSDIIEDENCNIDDEVIWTQLCQDILRVIASGDAGLT